MTNKTGTKKILSLREAITLFDGFANRRDLGFWHDENSCNLRATIMRGEMKAAGLKPGAVWAFGPSRAMEEDIVLRLPRTDTPATCTTHVAPTLEVRGASGRAQEMIFDPLLFDGPVTLKEWKKILDAKECIFVKPGRALPERYAFNIVPGRVLSLDDTECARLLLRRELKGKAFSARFVFASAARAVAMAEDKNLAGQSRDWKSCPVPKLV